MRDPEHIFKNHNSEILDYAADKARPESARSRTSRSSDGRETPMAIVSPERLDLAYNMTDEVEAVNKQLNFLEFGKVCYSLRAYLVKEVGQLLEDVQFLQSCLDEAADVRDAPTPALTSREPTLTGLSPRGPGIQSVLY
ncbi:coiled-coil domain-containing protein 24-like [Elysia marginata]|uniref:Coiled-coil domain-containing protein 24-like n=1 Tax=Elysia marginata TaxID=1093978 RepID=A0AAV4JJZ7_9GAST|nr:coiled-coil domain-containing protein 24-like [Elysia marginata]